MVAYSFRPRFVDPILMGFKRQTIRAKRLGRSRHAREGEVLQLYTGMRTQRCRLIGRATCMSVGPIFLLMKRQVRWDAVWTDGAWRKDIDDFARLDGFENWADMKAFWRAEHPGVEVFEGVLIRWEDLEQ